MLAIKTVASLLTQQIPQNLKLIAVTRTLS